jgi:lactoylglutathione lyase
MAKLRHIAIVVRDPEQSAKFFEQAFDMKVVGKARRGLYVSDGIFNVALLKVESEQEQLGISHFGMWVDDLDSAEKDALGAGAKYLGGRLDGSFSGDTLAGSVYGRCGKPSYQTKRTS